MHASQTLSQSGAFMESREEDEEAHRGDARRAEIEAGHVAAAAVRGPLKETSSESPIAAKSSGTLSRGSEA
jgi:cation transport regulator ChaB